MSELELERRIRGKITPLTASTVSTGTIDVTIDIGTGGTPEGLPRQYILNTTGTSLLTSPYWNVIVELTAEVRRLQKEFADFKGQIGSQRTSKVEVMKHWAEVALARNPVPEGEYAAVTFDGRLVAHSPDSAELLEQIQDRPEELFIWRVGTGHVTSW